MSYNPEPPQRQGPPGPQGPAGPQSITGLVASKASSLNNTGVVPTGTDLINFDSVNNIFAIRVTNANGTFSFVKFRVTPLA